MGLIFQAAENFDSDKLPVAPPEMEGDFAGGETFIARVEPNHTLLYEFNRVYLWEPEGPPDPVVYSNVQK